MKRVTTFEIPGRDADDALGLAKTVIAELIGHPLGDAQIAGVEFGDGCFVLRIIGLTDEEIEILEGEGQS